MEIVLKDGVYCVSGDITETCDLGSAKIRKGEVYFDLSGVRSINSCGVREWIAWMTKLEIKAIYMNCPQAVVMQFNMVPGFLGNGSTVLSFQVPSYCETCGKQEIHLLRSGKEFTPGQPVRWELKKCEKENCARESDVDFDSYFFFVENLPE